MNTDIFIAELKKGIAAAEEFEKVHRPDMEYAVNLATKQSLMLVLDAAEKAREDESTSATAAEMQIAQIRKITNCPEDFSIVQQIATIVQMMKIEADIIGVQASTVKSLIPSLPTMGKQSDALLVVQMLRGASDAIRMKFEKEKQA